MDNMINTKKSSFCDFDERIHLRKKEYAKNQKINNAYKKYWDLVLMYKQFVNCTQCDLDFPIQNYRLYDKGLYRRYDNTINLLTGYKKSLSVTVHTDNFKLERRLIRRLYVYLKIFSPKIDSTFEGIKDYYFFKNYPVENFVNFLTHFTYQYFTLCDGNLCYNNIPPYCIDEKRSKLLLVDYEVSKEIFTFFNMPVPSTSIRKKIFTSIKKDLSFDLPKNRILFLYDKMPILNINDYLGLINYQIRDNSSTCKDTKYYIEYDSSSLMYKATPALLPFNNYINYSLLNSPLDINNVPEKAASFLYFLTRGNHDCLNNIAILVTDILSHRNIHKRLHVIYCKPEIALAMQSFVNLISSKRCAHLNLSMNQLLSKNTIRNLMEAKYNSKTAIIIDNCLTSTTPKSYSEFKRILLGKQIFFDDSFVGSVRFKNNIALIRSTDNFKEINTYLNNMNINLINLSTLTDSISIDFSDEDIKWFLLSFALYGENIIHGRNLLPSEQKNEDNINPNPVIAFFDSFCIPSPSSKVLGSELYDYYVQYYSKYYGDNILSSIRFMKEMRSCLQEKKIHYQYGQVLHTKTSNARGFKGFSFDKEKFDDYLANNADKEAPSEFEDFKHYLLQMNNLVPKELHC